MANKKRRQSLIQRILRLSLIASYFSAPLLYAACDGDTGDDYYGNGQLCEFQRAVEGTEVVSPSDQAFMGSVDQSRIVNRGYFRAMIGQPEMKLSEWDMSAIAPSPFAGATVNINDEVSGHITQLSLALGRLWEQWAFEGELLLSKKLNFTQNFTDTTVYLTGDIKQFAFFLNLQYIIPRLFSWYPQRLQIHFDAGIGPALMQVDSSSYNSDGSPRQNESRQTITPAGNLGLGARYQITPSMLVDIAYRFFQAGEVKFSSEDADFKASKLSASGFFIGVMYEF